MGKLLFINNLYLYLLVYVLVPFGFLYGSRMRPRTFNTNFLSKQSTDQYRGLAIAIIMVHHFAQRMQDPGLLKVFLRAGVYAVAVFFFLSAYGLTAGLTRRGDYLQGFLSKRVSRVYLPFLLINIVAVFALPSSGHDYHGFKQIVEAVTLDNFHEWFIIAILLFYLFFWVSFRYFSPRKAPAVITLLVAVYMMAAYRLTGHAYWWYASCLCFPMGVFWGLHREQAVRLLSSHYVPAVLLSLVLFAALHLLNSASRYKILFQPLIFLPFMFMLLLVFFKMAVSSAVFGFLGRMSLEIYIIHVKVFYLYFTGPAGGQSYSVYIYVALVAGLAYILHRLFNLMYAAIEQKYKPAAGMA